MERRSIRRHADSYSHSHTHTHTQRPQDGGEKSFMHSHTHSLSLLQTQTAAAETGGERAGHRESVSGNKRSLRQINSLSVVVVVNAAGAEEAAVEARGRRWRKAKRALTGAGRARIPTATAAAATAAIRDNTHTRAHHGTYTATLSSATPATDGGERSVKLQYDCSCCIPLSYWQAHLKHVKSTRVEAMRDRVKVRSVSCFRDKCRTHTHTHTSLSRWLPRSRTQPVCAVQPVPCCAAVSGILVTRVTQPRCLGCQ